MPPILKSVGKFFAAAPGAIRGHLNVNEAVRVAVVALLAGGGAWGVLAAELVHLPELVTPADAGVAAAAAALVSEAIRRFGHGAAPPANFPAPAAANRRVA